MAQPIPNIGCARPGGRGQWHGIACARLGLAWWSNQWIMGFRLGWDGIIGIIFTNMVLIHMAINLWVLALIHMANGCILSFPRW